MDFKARVLNVNYGDKYFSLRIIIPKKVSNLLNMQAGDTWLFDAKEKVID